MTILLLPFTLSTAEWVTDPATFVALQVYSPMWVKSTSEMINMLVLVPTIVVVMLGPEFNFWPLRCLEYFQCQEYDPRKFTIDFQLCRMGD